MGSPGSGPVDCGVGSIVWVRRRNGSWWPGKILGPDELSSSHLTSPRSGTPVKLLGREDASVDWYNLEKSKRVKAFRCGEFDDCIERAESSQGMPIKKREKYARREDAILHALELEKQLSKKQEKLSLPSDCTDMKSSGPVKKRSENFKNGNPKVGNSESHQFSKRVYMSSNNEMDGPLSSAKAKEGIQPNGEDDHSEVTPRMRGLQDIGLRIAPSKRKYISTSAPNGSQKLAADSNAPTPHSAHNLGNTGDTNGVDQIGNISCAKRSRCVYVPAESANSLEHKVVSPIQIEMSVSHLGACRNNIHLSSLTEENTSALNRGGESDSSGTDSSNSETDSDTSETEQDVDNEMAALSEVEPNSFGRSEPQEHGSMSSEEPDDSALSGDISHLYSLDPVYANEAVSKWQLKGKRNSRNLNRRSLDGAYHESVSRQRALRQSSSFYRNDDFDDGIDEEGDMSEKDYRTKMIDLEDGYYLKSRAAPKGRSRISHNMIDWDDLTWEDRPALKGYWDDQREPYFGSPYDGFHQYGGRMRSMFVDVDLKVKASYRKERVPIVSLMSKFNGKAIIGHPIQIEALENGSSDTLLFTINNLGNGPIGDGNGNTTIPPSWRTARRTASFRVPRPHLSSSATVNGEEASAYDHPYVEQERKSTLKKSNAGSSSHSANRGRKTLPHPPQSHNDKKLPRKVAKKLSLTSNQKTRTLSSIAVGHNFNNLPINDTINCPTDGLIKPESSGPTTVACIPVKLVFSRLLEKINRPPSRSASNAISLISGSHRNP